MTRRWRRDRLARVTGALYLGFILASLAGDLLGHVGPSGGDAALRSVTEHPDRFRLGLLAAFVSALLFLLAAWGLYLLLRPVDDGLALLFLLLNAVGVAVQSASMLALLGALSLTDGASLQAITAGQAEEAAALAIDVYAAGFATAQIFFGTWLFPLGYLVYRSGLLPRVLGLLLLLDGVGILVWFAQALVLPEHDALSYPGLAVSLVAEVGLALWLLLRGVPREAEVGGQGDLRP
ncbi:DUF4386 domain-containing protein [Nocardioides sp. YIM 152588]|uniref:DUF4386 domain-containing protein n=1 Tax=Nocardioides sp. YIM 152588 TaxID=3158259 RepID=UPI0032E50F18